MSHFKPAVDQKNIFSTPVNQLKNKKKEGEETISSAEEVAEDYKEESSKQAEVVGEMEGYSLPEESSATKSDVGVMIALEFD